MFALVVIWDFVKIVYFAYDYVYTRFNLLQIYFDFLHFYSTIMLSDRITYGRQTPDWMSDLMSKVLFHETLCFALLCFEENSWLFNVYHSVPWNSNLFCSVLFCSIVFCSVLFFSRNHIFRIPFGLSVFEFDLASILLDTIWFNKWTRS